MLLILFSREKQITNVSHLRILVLQKLEKKNYVKGRSYNSIKSIRKFKYFKIYTSFRFHTGIRLKQNTDVLTYNQNLSFYLNAVILTSLLDTLTYIIIQLKA